MFGVAILLPLLVYYGVSTLHAPPKSIDYRTAVLEPGASKEERAARTERFNDDQTAFKDAQEAFAFRLFWASAPIGFAAILLGGLLPISPVGTGLIFGGLFVVTGGYWANWEFIPDWQRFLSLVAAGVVLLVAALHKTAHSPGAVRSA